MHPVIWSFEDSLDGQTLWTSLLLFLFGSLGPTVFPRLRNRMAELWEKLFSLC